MSRVDDIATLVALLITTLRSSRASMPGGVRTREHLWHLLDDDVPYVLARVRELERALKEYGRHLPGCASTFLHVEDGPCDCGFAALARGD